LLGSVLAPAALAGGARAPVTYVSEPVLEQLSASSLAVAPDGRNLYLLGGLDSRTRIAVVTRDARTGAVSRPLGRGACIRPWYLHPKDCRTGPALNNSIALAASPDGRDVAVGAYAAAQLAVFRRDPDGGLRVRSCAGERVPGFSCVPVRAMPGVEALAFSPDGRNLYVAARRDPGGLVALVRDPKTGALQQLAGAAGCFQRRRVMPEQPPCGVLPTDRYAPNHVVLTGDGRMLVTDSATQQGQGIFVFHRDPETGVLMPLTCYVSAGEPPCEPNDELGAQAITDLAVTRDGRTLIGANGRALVVFALDPATGELTQRQCVASTTATGCVRIAAPSPVNLALTRNGRLLVGDEDSIRVYSFRASGALVAGACVSAAGVAGCARLPARVRRGSLGPLVGSPDGRWLYSAGDRVLAFRISS
jgi:6-phosphogluconolactonase (cycloisomerase 2 family)